MLNLVFPSSLGIIYGMKQKPQILSTRVITKTRLFSVEELDLEFSNGATACFERIKGSARGGGVLVIPVLDDGNTLLVREYCAGVDRYELMFPKGRIEDGEPAEEAANRELQEEVGYAAHDLRLIKSLTLAPGYIGHSTHLVVAKNLYPSKLRGDEPEPLEVVPWPIADIEQLITRNDVTEGRTIAAAYMLRSLWEKGEL